MNDSGLPHGYTVEHLTELPANLAMTELGVRPCVAYLSTPEPSLRNRRPDVARDILPKLDSREVAAVFTAPFYNFLLEQDIDEDTRDKVPGEWYKGSWHSWHESAWRMHQFHVPVSPTSVFLARTPRSFMQPRHPSEMPKPGDAALVAADKQEVRNAKAEPKSALQPPLSRSAFASAPEALKQPRYRVFGMTARILVDAARVAYGEEPEYEHNSHFGDEDMIAKLMKIGRLGAIRKDGEILTREVMMKAAKAKM